MSLDSLYHGDSNTSSPPHTLNLPSWLTPLALLAGFAVLFLFTARDRLLPPVVMPVAPALLFETAEAGAAVNDSNKPATSEGELLFQASGWIEPDPFPIHVTALESGIVKRVHVLEGQKVTRGQLLVELIDDDTRIAVDEARSEVVRAKAKVQQAEALADLSRDEMDRTRKTGRAAAEQEVARARFEHQASSAAILAAEGELQLAQVRLEQAELAQSRMRIHSPVDGHVLALRTEPGRKVMLEMDDPFSATIATLYESGKLQARVDVPLADASRLFVGQRAEVITDFLPDRVFQGEVTRIAGSADIQRNTLQAKVRLLDADDLLRPEMLCRVRFFGRPAEQTNAQGANESARLLLIAPESAIMKGPEANMVWVVGAASNQLEKRAVTIGSFQRENWVEITAGLNAGEHLVLEPDASLREGKRIQPQLIETAQP